MNLQEAKAAWQADAQMHAANGISFPDVESYVTDATRRDYTLAMDAQNPLTTTGSGGVPALLTTQIDPQVFRVLYAPTKASQILGGEVRKGTWVDDTMLFPTVEATGEVSSYGDFNENGRAGVNMNWPQRQAYLFQVMKEYGDRELERAGLARINYVSELDVSAANVMSRFANLSYFYGVQGMQNYGLLNDPTLHASISPGTKANGNGNVWMVNGQINATANEVYADVQSIFAQVVAQSGGLAEATDKMVLATSPTSAVALTATNTFGINVYDLLKKNFPNIRFETAVQYGVRSATNPQGLAGGNFVQLIDEEIEGQQTGFPAFNEKMRAGPIIRATSSYRQKVTGGTWGAIIRQSFAIASMIGV